MNSELGRSSRTIFTSAIVVSLGIVLTTTLGERMGPVGIVFIAVGGLLFLAGMIQRAKEQNQAE